MRWPLRFAGTFLLIGAMLLLLSLSSVGCGRSPKQQAQDTARQFIAALDRGDGAGAKTLLTDAARERAEEPGSLSAGMFRDNADKQKNRADTTLAVGDAALDESGKDARVPFSHTDKDGKTSGGAVLLRQTDDGWRVYGIAVSVAESGPSITMNLEHPETFVGDAIGAALGSAFKGIGEGMGAMFKGIGEGIHAAEAGASPAAH